MHQCTLVNWCQYQSTEAPQYYSYLLSVSVCEATTVLQLPVASISQPMHHSTSVTCWQYESTNVPPYFSYLLPVSFYQCTTILQLPVAINSVPIHQTISLTFCQNQSKNILQQVISVTFVSISLTMHCTKGTSVTCYQYKSTNALLHSTSFTCCR